MLTTPEFEARIITSTMHSLEQVCGVSVCAIGRLSLDTMKMELLQPEPGRMMQHGGVKRVKLADLHAYPHQPNALFTRCASISSLELISKATGTIENHAFKYIKVA